MKQLFLDKFSRKENLKVTMPRGPSYLNTVSMQGPAKLQPSGTNEGYKRICGDLYFLGLTSVVLEYARS